ncbi:MAG: EutN/CcmL family microcompartment protein [Elusimicrobia bacterium]|nr:EutN/CcmL family microcompartment protein [Elusimicrobiota bacterium]
MRAAWVVGRVYCSRQDPKLDGKKLLLIQPAGWDRKPAGTPLVAADAVGAGAGEFVFYVSAREAAVAFSDIPPVDAAVVGIVDGCHLAAREDLG